MKKRIILLSIISLVIILGSIFALIFFPREALSYEYKVDKAFPYLEFSKPVGIYSSYDGTNRLFVVEQTGIIWVFDIHENETIKWEFLDISDLIVLGSEQGLLGLAFHPNFAFNGQFYVYYTQLDSGISIISRYTVSETDSNIANKTSEFVILAVDQPYPNHNGGQIAFGPDGYLYIGLGDGGSGGDPFKHGQNRQTLLGSILRIDIDSGSPYNIPIDNPFYGNTNGFKEEIFAFGFRNPWRFSFDTINGVLWVGDVGQNSWEEIDIVESGKNYGWGTFEGNHVFNVNSNSTIVESPIYEYANSGSDISIIGGFIYRGSSLTPLYDKYIYADYGSGKIWALEHNSGEFVENNLLIDTNLKISSFGIDSNNELYICSFDGFIYRLIEIETT